MEGWHPVSKIRKAVGIKVVVEDSKRCYNVAVRKRLKTVGGKELKRLKPLDSNLS